MWEKATVAALDGVWGVTLSGEEADMWRFKFQGKEDAVRYANICRQRTGIAVEIISSL